MSNAVEKDGEREDTESDVSLEDHEERITRLERLTDVLRDNLKEERDERREVAKELQCAQSTIGELEDQVETLKNEVDDQTEIMRKAMRSSSLKPTERAALLIQIMWRDAKRDPNGKATMTVKEAYDSLQRDVTRNAFYGEHGAFQKAVELVDDTDVLYLVKESRASKKNTRLVLDLEEGYPPQTAQGFDLTPQEAD